MNDVIYFAAGLLVSLLTFVLGFIVAKVTT